MLQSALGTPWPKAGKMSGNLFEDKKRLADHLLIIMPMTKTVTQLQLHKSKTPHKIRTPKPGHFKGRKMWMGTKLPHLQKGRGRLEWWPPETAATTATAPGTDDPNTVPSSPELPKTPELSEVQFKNIWCVLIGTQVSQNSVNNGKRKWRGSIANTIYTVFFWTLNLIWNWTKGKNTNMNIVMRHSFNENNCATYLIISKCIYLR